MSYRKQMENNGDILSSLAALDAQSLREASARIALLLQQNGKSKIDDPRYDSAVLVWPHVRECLLRRVGDSGPELKEVLAGRMRPRILRGCADVMAYIDKNIRPRTRTHRQAVARRMIDIVAGNIMSNGEVLSCFSLVRNLGRIAEIIESQFPGYLRSDLLPAVFGLDGKIKLDRQREKTSAA